MISLTTFTPGVPPTLAAIDAEYPDGKGKEVVARLLSKGYVDNDLNTAGCVVETVDGVEDGPKPTNDIVSALINANLLHATAAPDAVASAVFSVLNAEPEEVSVPAAMMATEADEAADDKPAAEPKFAGPASVFLGAKFAQLRQTLSGPAKLHFLEKVHAYRALKEGQQGVSALSDKVAAELQPWLDKYEGNGKRAAYAYLLSFYLSLV